MTTLYEKRGRRYVPVGEKDTNPYWTAGYWLVHVQPGLRKSRSILDPSYADVEAALDVVRQAMKASMEAECKRIVPYTTSDVVLKNHEKAWKLYKEAMGEEYTHTFQGASIESVIEAGLQEVRKKVKELSIEREKREEQELEEG